MEKFRTFDLGMLTANGFPVPAGNLVGEAPHLELVDPIPNQKQAVVQWVLVGQRLFAAGPLGRVTWRALECSGLDTKEGHKVFVEGMEFILRLPKIGADREIPWLPWLNGCWALGRDVTFGEDSFFIHGRIIRSEEENTLMFEKAGYEERNLSRRLQLTPVLEPVMPLLESLEGLYVGLLTPGGSAKAVLCEVTSYDLVCDNYSGPLDPIWGRSARGKTYIRRDVVLNAGAFGMERLGVFDNSCWL